MCRDKNIFNGTIEEFIQYLENFEETPLNVKEKSDIKYDKITKYIRSYIEGNYYIELVKYLDSLKETDEKINASSIICDLLQVKKKENYKYIKLLLRKDKTYIEYDSRIIRCFLSTLNYKEDFGLALDRVEPDINDLKKSIDIVIDTGEDYHLMTIVETCVFPLSIVRDVIHEKTKDLNLTQDQVNIFSAILNLSRTACGDDQERLYKQRITDLLSKLESDLNKPNDQFNVKSKAIDKDLENIVEYLENESGSEEDIELFIKVLSKHKDISSVRYTLYVMEEKGYRLLYSKFLYLCVQEDNDDLFEDILSDYLLIVPDRVEDYMKYVHSLTYDKVVKGNIYFILK